LVPRIPPVLVPRIPPVLVPRIPPVLVPRIPPVLVPRIPPVLVPRIPLVLVPRIPLVLVPRIPLVLVPRLPPVTVRELIGWYLKATAKLKRNLPTKQGLFENLALSQSKYVSAIKRLLTTIYHSQQTISPADSNSLTILTKGMPAAFRPATRLIKLSTSVISAVRVTDVNKMLPRHREGLPFQTYIFITCLVCFCRYFVNHSQPTTQCMTSQTSKYQYHFSSSNQS
jgi:hypothetical protein